MDLTSIQLMQGAAGASGDKVYVDDVFHTEAYVGTSQTPQNHVNGIDLAGEGGMLWVKDRDQSNNHVLFDTERGVTKMLRLGNSTAGEEDVNSGVFESFNSDGWTSGSWGGIGHLNNYGAWTFRNQDGFFKVVKWTGNGVSGRQIAHGLGSTPGFVMTKALDNSDAWRTLHRWDFSKMLYISSDAVAQGSASAFNGAVCDATHLTVTNDGAINANGQDYIAYVFAGGPSSAATARSVDFDGSGDYLTLASTSDVTFGTGDFTIEFWVKKPDSTQGGFFQISGTAGGFTNSNYQNTIAAAWNGSAWQMYGGGVDATGTGSITANVWYHIAVVKSSNILKMYVNGTSVMSRSDTNNYSHTYLGINGYYSTTYTNNGQLSNFRVVKGTAVYTSSFRPTYEPLTNITNTKLLCCNNSSVTGSTVTPGTITANGNPTASTDSPFDDPEGFKFGEGGDQNIIKCGSYIGNTSVAPEINCGWEPSFILIKCTSQGTTNWSMYDCIRGIITDGNEQYLYPNLNSVEYSADRLELTGTGFRVVTGGGVLTNVNGGNYIYVAIRRPDGYVGKPAEAGTDAFAMDTGNGSTTIPAYDSGFPVDGALDRIVGSSGTWYTSARLMGPKWLRANDTNGENSDNNYVFDSNVGYIKGNWADSGYQSWMWKRGAGFDVVTYAGNSTNREIRHSMGIAPTMVWLKSRTSSEGWVVGTSGLSSWAEYLTLNNSDAESTNAGIFNSAAPTATHFSLGSQNRSNENNQKYIAFLFASVEGISKVGSYSGNGSTQTITTGFSPRFLIIKRINGAGDWFVLDTLRGWGAGDDKKIQLNESGPQSDNDMGAPTATGFSLSVAGNWNGSGATYLYYAHA